MEHSNRSRFRLVDGNTPQKRAGIYVIQHIASGRYYVGISADLFRRIGEHERGRGGSGRLQEAIHDEGADAFLALPVFYSLYGSAGLAEIEAGLIAAYGTVEGGYNTAAQGRGCGPYGARFSDRIRAVQQSDTHKAKMAAANAKPEVSARRSAALRKSHSEPGLRARLSAIRTAAGSIARLHSPEAKAKSAAARDTPEWRANVAANMKAFHADPAGKAKHLAASLRANADPKRNARISASRKGLRWITNGLENRAIRETEPPNGWRFGKTNRPKPL